MLPSSRAEGFIGGAANARYPKANAVVPVPACDERLDAAEGGNSSFRHGNPLQGERLGGKSLRLRNLENELTPEFCTPDPSFMRAKSPMADTSVSCGKQQSRLTAQLVAKQMRRPSQLHESLDFNQSAVEEAGPWVALRKDLQIPPWKIRLKEYLQRVRHILLIKPNNARLHKWFYLCVLMAVLSGWEVPFHFAFLEPGGLLKPYNDWVAIVECISTAVFFLDFLLKFFVMYIDPESGVFVTSRRKIAWRYMTSWQFYMDVLGWFPMGWIATDTAAAWGANSETLVGLAWIKLLSMVRMYRLFELFSDLDYRMVLSQGALMLTRNYTYVFFTTHWAACILYHIAAHQNFSPASWVGRNTERLIGKAVYEKYLLSLYFSISAFTGLGDGELFASTVPEAAFMIVYLWVRVSRREGAMSMRRLG